MTAPNPGRGSNSSRTKTVALVVASIAAVVVAVTVVKLGGRADSGSAHTSSPPSTARSPDTPQNRAPDGDLQALVGEWRRPDGGYVLQIRSVAADGTVEAAYFNPRPISVSMARASSLQGAATLFVEFDDVNYRGSTYELVHVPERNLLHGTYYQAAFGQTFEVVFVPIK